MERKTQFYGVFRILAVICTLLVIARWVLFGLQKMNQSKLSDIQKEAKTEQTKLTNIEKTPSYQKISFVEKLNREAKKLPWSTHITKLIDVLKDVQNIGEGKIELYDFKVNLDSIEISWKASTLAHLYAPTNTKNEGLISAVSKLDFLNNIRIQHYEKPKDENMYEFTLYANIILNEND